MCPVCALPMVAFELDGVEVDRCVECGGTWLDAGEFIAIAGLDSALPDSFSRALVSAREVRRTRRRCPRCPRRLHEIELGRDPVIVLDRCRRGHGLWFDKGEMIALVRSFAGDRRAGVVAFLANVCQNDIPPIGEGD